MSPGRTTMPNLLMSRAASATEASGSRRGAGTAKSLMSVLGSVSICRS